MHEISLFLNSTKAAWISVNGSWKMVGGMPLTRMEIVLLSLLLLMILAIVVLIVWTWKIRKLAYERRSNEINERTEMLRQSGLRLEKEIVEREKYQQELSFIEKQYREIFDATSEAIFIHDAETGQILDVNRGFEKMYGYTREEAVRMKPENLTVGRGEFQDERALELIRKAKEEGPQIFEWQARRRSRELFWAEVSLYFSRIGKENRVIAVVRDVNLRRLAEKALRENEEKYRTLFESAGDAIFLMENECFVECNEMTLTMFGCKREDILGETPIKFSPDQQPDGLPSREKALGKIEAAFRGEPQVFEWQHIKLDGTPFYADVSLNLVNLQDKKLLQAIVRDITQKKMAESALESSEEKYRMIIENAPSVFWISDRSGKTHYISPNVRKIYGFSQQEIYDKEDELWLKRIHREDIDAVLDSLRDLFEKGSQYKVQYRILNSSGHWMWLNDTGELLVSEKGENLAYGVFTDITEQKNAEQAVRESEAYYRSLYENISDGIFILDIPEGGKYKMAGINPALEKIIGKSWREVENLLMPEVLPADAVKKLRDRLQYCIREKEPAYFEEELNMNDRQWILSTTLIPIKNEEGRVFRIIGVSRDVTEKKMAQQQIYSTILKTEESERSRIAKDLHDGLGPILSTIKLYVDWLLDPNKKTGNAGIVEKIDTTLNEAMISLKEISNNLSPHILQNYGLVAALNAFIEKIRAVKKISIQVDSTIRNRLNETIETTIYRILTECINNTLKYAKAEEIHISLNEDMEEVSFEYSDNGIGFEVKETLSTPRGMGLANLRNRIGMIGGEIEIVSKKKQGTKITGRVKTTQFF